MGEELSNPVERLLEISLLDQRIARVVAQRRQQLATIQEKTKELEEAKKIVDEAILTANSVRDRYDLEQREIRAEREKLKARRKALSTFNNHKIQQSALLEIERNDRLIGVREESLFAIVDSLDEVEAVEKQGKARLEECELSVQEAQESSREECLDLEGQFKDARKARDELLTSLAPDVRRTYDHVYERFPADPVVRIDNNHCAGCFMMIPPQILVDIVERRGLVKCRGCGRLLAPEKLEN
jgi:uncharacterized protein